MAAKVYISGQKITLMTETESALLDQPLEQVDTPPVAANVEIATTSEAPPLPAGTKMIIATLVRKKVEKPAPAIPLISGKLEARQKKEETRLCRHDKRTDKTLLDLENALSATSMERDDDDDEDVIVEEVIEGHGPKTPPGSPAEEQG